MGNDVSMCEGDLVCNSTNLPPPFVEKVSESQILSLERLKEGWQLVNFYVWSKNAHHIIHFSKLTERSGEKGAKYSAGRITGIAANRSHP